MAAIGVDDPDPSRSPVRELVEGDLAIPAAAATSMSALRTLLADLADESRAVPLASQIERIRAFCAPVFMRVYGNAEVRCRDLEQLEVLGRSATSRNAFLTDLALDPPDATSDLAGAPLLDDDYLILSTIHSAKGESGTRCASFTRQTE